MVFSLTLKKALDTADHKNLYERHNYGICGVRNKWFSSYLQGRTQKTANRFIYL